jgi:branched-chain amino acid transport system permease protein
VEVVDRNIQVYVEFERRLRPRIRALLSDELIAEHAAAPLGQHSDDLQRVMNYFRRQPQPGKYILVATKPWQEYRIGTLSGRRGAVVKILGDETFASEEEGLHGIFLQRVADLRAAD